MYTHSKNKHRHTQRHAKLNLSVKTAATSLIHFLSFFVSLIRETEKKSEQTSEGMKEYEESSVLGSRREAPIAKEGSDNIRKDSTV